MSLPTWLMAGSQVGPPLTPGPSSPCSATTVRTSEPQATQPPAETRWWTVVLGLSVLGGERTGVLIVIEAGTFTVPTLFDFPGGDVAVGVVEIELGGDLASRIEWLEWSTAEPEWNSGLDGKGWPMPPCPDSVLGIECDFGPPGRYFRWQPVPHPSDPERGRDAAGALAETVVGGGARREDDLRRCRGWSSPRRFAESLRWRVRIRPHMVRCDAPPSLELNVRCCRAVGVGGARLVASAVRCSRGR
jgi:hypothetical protein